jgi:hypothetical protein
MSAEREELGRHIRELGQIPVGMERWARPTHSLSKAIQDEIRACHIFVMVVGHDYGASLPSSRLSYLEEELNLAENERKPTLIFLQSESESPRFAPAIPVGEPDEISEERLENFRQRILNQRVAPFFLFRDPEDLRMQLDSHLVETITRLEERQTPILDVFDFNVSFAAELSWDQVAGSLSALADYYRNCGGLGFELEFDLQTVDEGERTRA